MDDRPYCVKMQIRFGRTLYFDSKESAERYKQAVAQAEIVPVAEQEWKDSFPRILETRGPGQ
jgi:hypothetical protein